MRLFIFILLVFSQVAFAEDDTRRLSAKPKEIYGKNQKNIGLRIGNSVAGPTGILRALAEDYLEKSKRDFAIAWYQDISVNTLKHLRNGKIDIALVYEKSQGDAAQQEGWATNYTVIFNDHFLIVGPKNNPANIGESDSVTIAFSKIAGFGGQSDREIFLSRDDNSGTNAKEKSIWKSAKLEPWEGSSKWYSKHHLFSKEALLRADQERLYTITEWGTWLSNQKDLRNSVIFLKGGKALLNPCFALLGASPSKNALEFLEYLESPRAQKLIADFGKDKYAGQALFTEEAQRDFE